MIEATIIIIDKNKTEVKKADIDPAASFDRIKRSIINGLTLGEPNDYEIFISPKSQKDPIQNYIPADGDKIAIIKKDNTNENPVKFK